MMGGYGRGRRHRRMYYATGVPGYGRGRCFWAHPMPAPPEVVYPGIWPGTMDPYGPMVQAISEQDELKMLEEEEQLLRQELEGIRQRHKELSETKKEK